MCVDLEIESYKCLYIVGIGTHVFTFLKTYIAGKKKMYTLYNTYYTCIIYMYVYYSKSTSTGKNLDFIDHCLQLSEFWTFTHRFWLTNYRLYYTK